MKYLVFIWADGLPAPEDLAVMQREIPGFGVRFALQLLLRQKVLQGLERAR